MPEENSSNSWTMVIGVLGIFALLLCSLAYALWDSRSNYEIEQLNQIISEQASRD